MGEEIFDVCDAQDRVVGRAARSEVHRRGLLHRAVHVFVFNGRGELLLQKRAATKDEYPLRYTSSASGHLSAGETYDECAPRELQEELELSSPLEYLTKFAASPETAYEHSALYRTVTDEPPVFDAGEIAGGEFVTLDRVAEMIERSPEEFTPPFRVLFAWYLENRA